MMLLSLLFEDRAAIRHDSASVEERSNMMVLVYGWIWLDMVMVMVIVKASQCEAEGVCGVERVGACNSC